MMEQWNTGVMVNRRLSFLANSKITIKELEINHSRIAVLEPPYYIRRSDHLTR
jgi:hypothetical protein